MVRTDVDRGFEARLVAANPPVRSATALCARGPAAPRRARGRGRDGSDTYEVSGRLV